MLVLRAICLMVWRLNVFFLCKRHFTFTHDVICAITRVSMTGSAAD